MKSMAEGRQAYLRTIAQLDAERAAARPIVEQQLANISDAWDQEIPAAWRTAGFVQELTSHAAVILEQTPRESLALAQLALSIATSIPPGEYPDPIQAQLEGSAWKEIGTAHRYLSEYDAALRAYDCAERCFASANTLTHDEAIVDFARAIVLTDLGRHDDALALLAKTIPLLRSFADERRLLHAGVLKGVIHYRRGEFTVAREIYDELVAPAHRQGDLHTIAMIYHNLGLACADMDDHSNAVTALQHARAIFEELGMAGEVSRTTGALARVLLSTGDFHRAIPLLERARDEFLGRGMPEEAGVVGLDLVEALLATEQRDNARLLLERVVGEFTAAHLNVRAVTALAYLRDVLPTTRRPQRAVRHVREYLQQLRTEPARLFLPLGEE